MYYFLPSTSLTTLRSWANFNFPLAPSQLNLAPSEGVMSRDNMFFTNLSLDDPPSRASCLNWKQEKTFVNGKLSQKTTGCNCRTLNLPKRDNFNYHLFLEELQIFKFLVKRHNIIYIFHRCHILLLLIGHSMYSSRDLPVMTKGTGAAPLAWYCHFQHIQFFNNVFSEG